MPVSIRAGIVVTGTEVLTARTQDRNGPWVSERLGERGVEVFFHVAGDYRRKSVICEGEKWRSQWRRLGAAFPAQ